MPMPGFPERPITLQQFQTYAITAGVAATPLSSNQALQGGYLDSFAISVPSTAANTITIGGPGVILGKGLELGPGSLTQFGIDQGGRQFYELQKLLISLARVAECQNQQADMLPFVCWDPSQIYTIAVAPTDIVVAPFWNPFV